MEQKKMSMWVGLKGVIVYAKYQGNRSGLDWIILVSSVEMIDTWPPSKKEPYLGIKRYLSYNVGFQSFLINEIPQVWGQMDGYDFYEPTEEQKKIVIDELAKKGYKFVPVLNKLIKKK